MQPIRGWQRHFSSGVRLFLVHLPGRGARIDEPPFTRLPPLISALAEAIAPETEGRFAFWGHSMGAMISFELARELRRRRLPGPRGLFLSGRTAPHALITDVPMFSLPEDEFIAELQRLNGTPKTLFENPETRQLFLPAIRADFEVVETYQYVPEAPLPCPIYAYGGVQDTDVTRERLSAWQKHTSARCRVRMFSGDHFFIHNPASGFLYALRDDALELATHSPQSLARGAGAGAELPRPLS